MKKRILISVSAILLLAVLFALCSALVVPKYTDEKQLEGRLIGEYYQNAGGHDVIFIGDCEVYESFVPAVMWEKYGISSYIRGSSQQLAWHSYYILEETFKYESPKAVVFNVLALKYGETPREEISRMTLEDMAWSDSKWHAIRASMTEEESLLSYFAPILRYHGRWSELTLKDLTNTFDKHEDITHQGYLMQTDIVPVDPDDTREPEALIDSTLPLVSMEYLKKMQALCEQYGAELVLIKAPTNSVKYYWYDEWDAQIVEYAKANDLTYYNFVGMEEELGLDWSRDTYDAGLHLNVYGAEKLTVYLGKLLQDEHGVQSRQSDAELDALWKQRIEQYETDKQKGENDS